MAVGLEAGGFMLSIIIYLEAAAVALMLIFIALIIVNVIWDSETVEAIALILLAVGTLCFGAGLILWMISCGPSASRR